MVSCITWYEFGRFDDPGIWGTIPTRYLWSKHQKFRWALGAREICHSNWLYEWFFTLGQTLPIVRGHGIYQPVMDFALELLNRGEWIHFFPEGRVIQSPFEALLRWKWGMARLILECNVNPVLIPIWHSGFNHMLPMSSLKTTYLIDMIPRPGKDIIIAFGKPFQIDDNRRKQYTLMTKKEKYALKSEVMHELYDRFHKLRLKTKHDVMEGQNIHEIKYM